MMGLYPLLGGLEYCCDCAPTVAWYCIGDIGGCGIGSWLNGSAAWVRSAGFTVFSRPFSIIASKAPESKSSAFLISLATSIFDAAFNWALTKETRVMLHLISMSSRRYRPSAGAPIPNSAIWVGSPGWLPAICHLFFISIPMGA